MEYVIRVIDPETKDIGWYKDGSVIFEITDDISQAKRFESGLDAECKKSELMRMNPQFLFCVKLFNDEPGKYSILVRNDKNKTESNPGYYSEEKKGYVTKEEARRYERIEDAKNDLQYVHEKTVVYGSYTPCVEDITTGEIVYTYGDDGITKNSDAVNHQKQYQDPSGIECIDIVRHRDFDIGSAIQCLWMTGLKQDADKTPIEKQIEDLRKAICYIQDEITTLESKKSKECS